MHCPSTSSTALGWNKYAVLHTRPTLKSPIDADNYIIIENENGAIMGCSHEFIDVVRLYEGHTLQSLQALRKHPAIALSLFILLAIRKTMFLSQLPLLVLALARTVTGDGLNNRANGVQRYFGTAMNSGVPGDEVMDSIAINISDFGQYTCEYQMKWTYTEPQQNK